MRSCKSRLFVSVCLLANWCSPASAANLPFGQTQTGTISSAAQTNSYTFSANASDVVDFTLVVTSGSLIPKIQLYNPTGGLISSNYSGSPFSCSGSSLELNTVQLATAGTYTVDVSDCSATNTGNYALFAQRTNNATGAANLPFGQVESGTIGAVASSNSYFFSANANDEIDFTLAVSSGTLIPKIRVYNPNGTQLSSNYSGSPFSCSGSTLELNTVMLPTTGVYTVLVGDCADTNTGGYDIYAQLTDSPAGPVGLLFGQVQTGSITSLVQSNSFTFSANANDVVDFTLATTSGSLVPKIRVYNPTGTLLSSNYSGSPFSCSGSTLELNTVTLPSAGTYTVLIGDCSDTLTGNYAIYTQRINNPAGAVNLPFGQTQTGLQGSVAGSNTYTFSANANDVMDFTLVTTNGSMVPKIRLYNPTGTLLSSNYSGSPFSCSGATLELNTVTLPSTGTYTVLIGDCSDTLTGNFVIYTQRTNNPAAAINLLWGQVQSGSVGSTAQSDAYTFLGSASDMVNLTMVTTGGSLVPKVRLYNPDGTLLSSNYSGSPFSCSGSTVQLNSVKLTQSGIYTVLFGDCSDINTGNFTFSSQCFGTCPLPAPMLTSLSPASALAGGNGFTLTVYGLNFVTGPSSVVYWNGSSLVTTYVNPNQLTAAVPASDIATPGAFPVTVLNPNPVTGPSNAITFTVNGALGQTITFGTLPNQFLGTAPFAVSAVASSGLPVSFASMTPGVCMLSNSTVTLTGVGTCTIQATQAGNATYSAAAPVNQSFTVSLATGSGPGPVTIFSPAQGATGVSLSTALIWGAVTGATSYDVYFGTSPSPPFVENTTGTSYTQAALNPNTTYYWYLVSKNAAGSTPSAIWSFTTAGSSHPAFFNGEVALSSTIYYLQFPGGNLFGDYTYLSSSILYHFDMGYEGFIPSTDGSIYFYDFATGHWWYTNPASFPYLYDFTLNAWIFYFPNPADPGHYTTNPRYFSNLATDQIFTM